MDSREPSLALLSAVILGLFFGLERYTELSEDAVEQVDRYYMYFIHVQIMVFVGFGFLMTFMRRYSHSAVALNYLASALVMLEAVLVIGATQQGFWNQKRSKIQIDIPLLIDASFCAASGMIAFGAIIGKSTPTQTLWLLVFQVPLYALNQRLVVHTFKALDMGGTIVIHLFGAYYGLAASLMLSRGQPLHGLTNPKNCGSHLNDLFAMIGTLFLFIYWPSFNGALASVSAADLAGATDAAKLAQFLAIVNTLLSLLGAVLAVFGTSALLGGRFNMVHVQNSTLAGGVAMGAACTLRMTPGSSLAVGLGAGVISTLGFTYLTPFLDRTIGLGDTCGVHNLHGIPAILGALAAGLAALGQHSDYLLHANGAAQLGYQVLASVATVGIAGGGGLLGGWAASWINPLRHEPLLVPELFDDGPWWNAEHVEPLLAQGSTYPGHMSAHGVVEEGVCRADDGGASGGGGKDGAVGRGGGPETRA
ncbi:Ammonium transporter Rh type A [Tetrabaena socialis]|uniref:Ammonium transporter Rh type A n=1 Tax=Tetrabaena socialis TaxID=47790 RepID=A0A2J8ACN5_9CHLO|nr:Ammonium transporter Rh type A [Tetrabaena socialis]|eukprot:PNH10280.1 Ammonium transporter Rh type A [Tetrabaena socialis]